MKIENGKLVTITYSLNLDDYTGELIERVTDEEPTIFMFGGDEMLESFEAKLLGLNEGDTFQFSLPKEDAYGDEDDEAIAEFPIDVFQDDEGGIPKVGDYVPMEDEAGTVFDGIAIQVTKENVVLDFNHPLVGKDLFFTGKVIKVENAENE